jgi:glycosyltransferase involved in cell wall biosynthesis
MCGTPVVTTDWGAFTETVKPGISGERFGTMNEGVKAVEMVSELPSTVIRQYALDHYSFPVIGRKFDKYFERVSYDQS